MKGRVLTVDAASNKATVTLKRSLTRDKRSLITNYAEASHFLVRHGGRMNTRAMFQKAGNYTRCALLCQACLAFQKLQPES